MSRVRILNLPRDCTEEQLRRYLLNSLPPSAPHMEITDCVIKRSSPVHGGKSVIRMAFVGFRNAASGHFVVRHFDGTYFGSAKLRVELAKGLADIGITTNMKKKMKGLTMQQDVPDAAASEGKNVNAPKRGRSATRETPSDECAGEKGVDGNAVELRKKKERKEEFIAERTKTTSGPTWASEVLLPGSTEPNAGSSTAGEADVGIEPHDGDAEEAERLALERQQMLGAVSDMDFLSSLSKKTGTSKENIGDSSNITGEQVDGVVKEGGEKEDQLNGGKEQGCITTLSVSEDQVSTAQESRRVRLGSIPFTATEDEVKQFVSSLVGPVEAVHIPLTRDTRQSKGAVFVKFVHAADAVRALTLCRGAIFMGRLIRVSAAVDDPYAKKSEENKGGSAALAGCSEFKRQKAQERCKEGERGGEGGVAALSWNTTYMNSHAAVEAVAKRLGVAADAVVSVGARGAAVRAAIAEAYLTTEVQQVLSDEGIDFSLLESAQQNLLKARSRTTIIVKNIQVSEPEDAAQLSKMFLRYGALEATAFPSAGAFALFRYVHQQDARVAFQRLSYKLFKNAPLFLEWAPIGSILDEEKEEEEGGETKKRKEEEENDVKSAGMNDNDGGRKAAFAPVLTLFITNIPFTSTEEEFYTFLLDACPRIAKTPEKHVVRLAFEHNKGRAFLTLQEESTMVYVQQRLNGRSFSGRTLACVQTKQTAAALKEKTASVPDVASRRDDDDDDVAKASTVVARQGAGAHHGASHVPPGCDALKLVVKNVPFEATERDIRELFSAFSEIRSVRLPRKSHQFTSHRENNHRGFAFVEFLSEEEARRAMETLRATHLYGRHLVLQYAKLDDR